MISFCTGHRAQSSEAKHLGPQQGLHLRLAPSKAGPTVPTQITCLEWDMPGGGECPRRETLSPSGPCSAFSPQQLPICKMVLEAPTHPQKTSSFLLAQHHPG